MNITEQLILTACNYIAEEQFEEERKWIDGRSIHRWNPHPPIVKEGELHAITLYLTKVPCSKGFCHELKCLFARIKTARKDMVYEEHAILLQNIEHKKRFGQSLCAMISDDGESTLPDPQRAFVATEMPLPWVQLEEALKGQKSGRYFC